MLFLENNYINLTLHKRDLTNTKIWFQKSKMTNSLIVQAQKIYSSHKYEVYMHTILLNDE